MQSLVARLESKELHTSKDISSLSEHIACKLSRVDFSLDAISKSLQVLQTEMYTIAQKMETLENLGRNPKPEVPPETNLPAGFAQDWSPISETDLENLLKNIPESGTFPDITCYETI